MYETVKKLIDDAKRIVIIQPENPDADSLGSAIALDELLAAQDKDVTMYCAIDMPKYLRYITGWDRVESDWAGDYDLAVIVDTSAEALLIKTLERRGVRHFLETHPVVVIDHHIEGDEGGNDLPFPHELLLDESAAATSEIIYNLSIQNGWVIDEEPASAMLASILGDTLGLSTRGVTTQTIKTVAGLMELGAHPASIDEKRRIYMKKPADILEYKSELIQRIEYYCGGRLATVHIPWEEIEKYSDRYNPSVLVLDEMRLVESVDIAVAFKTYPDGKLTAKIRSNSPIAQVIAGYFGGGGHTYAAGFKIYETYEKTLQEVIAAVEKTEEDNDKTV